MTKLYINNKPYMDLFDNDMVCENVEKVVAHLDACGFDYSQLDLFSFVKGHCFFVSGKEKYECKNTEKKEV